MVKLYVRSAEELTASHRRNATVEWGYRVASSVYIFSVYFKLRNLYEIKSDLTSFKHSIIQQKVAMWQ